MRSPVSIQCSLVDALSSELLTMAKMRVGGTVVVCTKADAFITASTEDAITVNRAYSKGMLLRYFDKHRRGHDGAVMLSSDLRLCYRQLYLPYSNEPMPGVIRQRGMRHRSALYASRRTDAFFIVVSEERGSISVFHRGRQLTCTSSLLTVITALG